MQLLYQEIGTNEGVGAATREGRHMSEWVGIPKDNMSCPCLLLGNTAPLVVYFLK